MKKWKVALIGCGSIADNTYLPRIGEIPEADLVAVCDIIPERAKNYAEKFHVPAWYTSIDELLEKCDFEILMNTTSIPAHHEINMKALRAGKHLYSQKPVGLTVEEVTEQIEAAKAAGVKYTASPIHMLRDDIRFAKKLIADGCIGEIMKVHTNVCHGGPEYFQYRTADELSASCRIARSMIFGKVYNARWSIERTRRDHGLRLDSASLTASASHLKELLPQIAAAASLEHLRGLEGAGATLYFGQFDQLILGEKPLFSYQSRSRRPPRDPVNALLSFVYSLLSHDCASALESVGLDSYVGFLHRDRPGRASLALDLMEELRPCMADRFVLTLINNRMVGRQDFDFLENGAVFLSDSGRRSVLKRWQERKKESLTHPYLQEKLSWGLVPYLQALLLARCLRGDLDAYPPFLWK